VIYAIGDIHGELPLLEKLLDEIRWDARNQPDDEHKIIFIGDYVDRGLHSRGVIELVMQGIDGFETICLRGNHEQMFLDFLEEPTLDRAESWNRDFVGGRDTLASYDIDLKEVILILENGGEVKDLLAKVHDHHIEWMSTLPHEHHEDGFMFVHAGIMPGISLEAQRERDLLWIRDTFLNSKIDHGSVIVHGHSSRRNPEALHNRINIDTGACLFGTLTAVVLEALEPRFIQVKGDRTAPFPPQELLDRRIQEARERGEI
jgi:diadenosine tetraphosphatase ApaH/serine/threonine PP2A family protein phosphatase